VNASAAGRHHRRCTPRGTAAPGLAGRQPQAGAPPSPERLAQLTPRLLQRPLALVHCPGEVGREGVALIGIPDSPNGRPGPLELRGVRLPLVPPKKMTD
jgi:hypothetical protein